MRKSEKETVIRWDSAEKVVHVYSCHPRVWRRAERKGYQPVGRQHVIKGRETVREYRIPLTHFGFRFRALNQPPRPAPKGAFKPKTRGKPTRK
jgi:hypothetical protein